MSDSPALLLLKLVMVTRRVIDVAGVDMLDEAEREVLSSVSRYLRTTYGGTQGGDDDRGLLAPERR